MGLNWINVGRGIARELKANEQPSGSSSLQLPFRQRLSLDGLIKIYPGKSEIHQGETTALLGASW